MDKRQTLPNTVMNVKLLILDQLGDYQLFNKDPGVSEQKKNIFYFFVFVSYRTRESSVIVKTSIRDFDGFTRFLPHRL
jgi:hypothetical protein